MMISPNPSVDETTLSIKSESLESQLESGNAISLFDENVEWEFAVYDNVQNLKLKKEKLKGRSITINTQGWKEGIYVVRVKYGDIILSEKLIVTR